jgi:hypothetical protein
VLVYRLMLTKPLKLRVKRFTWNHLGVNYPGQGFRPPDPARSCRQGAGKSSCPAGKHRKSLEHGSSIPVNGSGNRIYPVPRGAYKCLSKPAAGYGHRISGTFRRVPTGNGEFPEDFLRKFTENCVRNHRPGYLSVRFIVPSFFLLLINQYLETGNTLWWQTITT